MIWRGFGCYIPEEGETLLDSYERRERDRDVDQEIDELKEELDAND